MINNKIGYIINESSVNVSEVDIIEQGNRVVAEGTLQDGDSKNRNGRIYRTEDLAREIVAPRQQELFKTKNMLGEAGHPMTKDLARQQTIDPQCTCVRYLKFWMQGNLVKGRFKGTNNNLGDTFDKDLREGVLPAFSLRALGSIAATREGAVVENLKMITYDYVIYPSHSIAYTDGIVSESGGLWVPDNKKSNFVFKENMDATKSSVMTFNNADVVEMIKKTKPYNESALDYIKDKSFNYYMIKECFDLTGVTSFDFVDKNHVALTEAGVGTIVVNVEDYISKEIQNYVR